MSIQEAIRPGQEAEVQLLLSAYAAKEAELKAQAALVRRDQALVPADGPGEAVDGLITDAADDVEETCVGWVPRLKEVTGVPGARLGPLHGQLIALGLLKFQLTGRTGGIMYRVSPEGRAELQRSDEREGDCPARTAA